MPFFLGVSGAYGVARPGDPIRFDKRIQAHARVSLASEMKDTLVRGDRTATGAPPAYQVNQSIPEEVKVLN